MEHKDCFAYEGEGCGILKELYCKNEECRFYKTKEQYEGDLKKYGKDNPENG